MLGSIITKQGFGVIFHRRSWHGFTTTLFSNFLFKNLFSIKFLYFFIFSSLFPYFNLFVSIFLQSYAYIKLLCVDPIQILIVRATSACAIIGMFSTKCFKFYLYLPITLFLFASKSRAYSLQPTWIGHCLVRL